MIRCLVVDDEPLALDILEDYISKVPFLSLVKTTTSAIEGLSLVQSGSVDLVFLDVQMPELTGIQFLKIINCKCDVILTTAYSQYALDGYELDVVDYLLKPIAFDRFYKAAQKVLQSKSQGSIGSPELSTIKNTHDFIFVKTEHKIQKIYLDDILFIEGLKDYISIFTRTERIITLQNMKKVEESLPAKSFIRVHKSYIIALGKIESIERSRILIGEKVIPIGDTYREYFFKQIEDKNIG
jgi:two-component system LytT family response regulator